LLADAIAARGYEVELLTLIDRGPLRSLVDEMIRIVPVGAAKLRSAVPGLRRTLQARRPDVLVSAETVPNLVAIAASLMLPRSARPLIVVREVGSPSVSIRLDPYRQTRIAYWLVPLLYRFADLVVTLTDGAFRDLSQRFWVPRAKLARIACNAVIDARGAKAIAGAALDREPGLIVAVGRLSPEKDHATLIRACSRLDPGMPWRLEIAGTGPQQGSLEALVHDLGLGDRVRLVGFISDPFTLLRRATVAVSSSRFEGFGNAIVEALACGTPVVSTDCPYGPREILAAGQFGALVPVGDADAMARAISHALTAEPDRQALRARASAHTVEHAADALLALIIGRNRSPN
jgi:glycosyltransferase involved in cell wall biosynthesis